jgi:hypothetical protein
MNPDSIRLLSLLNGGGEGDYEVPEYTAHLLLTSVDLTPYIERGGLTYHEYLDLCEHLIED